MTICDVATRGGDGVTRRGYIEGTGGESRRVHSIASHAMTTTNYTEWLKSLYDSVAARDDAHAETETAFRDWCNWSLAVCEDAGIPWHGWRADVLRCARQRMAANESERPIVRSLNAYDPSHRAALDQWLGREYDINSAYYS